jgi:hypothetical protein
MKKTLLALLVAFLLIGCGSKATDNKNVEPKLVVGKTLENLTFDDQFGKSHTLNPNTYKLVFAFAKAPAHVCNDFFKTKPDDYLAKHNAEFIADISAAPSLIRSMFVIPGLKDLKHTVLVINDRTVAAPFRKGMNTDKIVVVSIINKKITDIKTISTPEELQKTLEDDSPISIIAPMINEALDTANNIMK